MSKKRKGSNVASVAAQPTILASASGATFDPSLFRKQHDKCLIIGFAPHHVKAPIQDPDFDVWVLNELYTLRPELKARVEQSGLWFQMHGYEPPTVRDPKQKEWLADLKAPVVMWWKHPQIPTAVAFPIDYVEEHFFPGQPCSYFTNSISYMIALAILLKYREIHVFGVDMAQDQEFIKQRPSCEFFLGWALAVGIEVVMPFESDLLKTWHRYGLDPTEPYIAKMEARTTELENRRAEVKADIEKRQQEKGEINQQISNLNANEHQVIGAQQMLETQPTPTAEQLASRRAAIQAELAKHHERIRVLDNEIGGLNAWDHQLIGALSDNEYMKKLGPPRTWEEPPGPPHLVPIEAEIRKWCPVIPQTPQEDVDQGAESPPENVTETVATGEEPDAALQTETHRAL